MADGSSVGRSLRGLGLALASLLLLAGALELSLRLFWGGYYEKYDPERPFGPLDFHPTRALTPAPGIDRLDWNREFQVRLRHNSLGWRSPEIALEKPPGRTRVLVVGDSMTYGIGVENEETFCAVLEALEPRLQVIDAGVPGYSGAQELLLLREHMATLAPDLVIVAFFWNDLWSSYRDAYPRVVLREGEPHFVAPEPATPAHPVFDRLHRRHARRGRRYGLSLADSYLYRLVSDRIKIARYAWRDLQGEVPEVVGSGELASAERAEAWELAYALLRAQRDLARAHGADFALLVVPDQLQVEPDVRVYGVPEELPRVQEKLASFATREGIAWVDPLPRLREVRLRSGEPQYHRFDRHWNRVGHREVARVLLAELRRQGLAPLPPRPGASEAATDSAPGPW